MADARREWNAQGDVSPQSLRAWSLEIHRFPRNTQIAHHLLPLSVCKLLHTWRKHFRRSSASEQTQGNPKSGWPHSGAAFSKSKCFPISALYGGIGFLELRPDEIEAINQALKPEMERAARIASEFQRAIVAQERRD